MPLGYADVDARVRDVLAQQGIQKLYPPQEEALDAALGGRNLVLSIPTASGKSLVAYLAILHRHLAMEPRGKSLYIVPLRALASEKYEELRAFKDLGLRVGVATGDLDDQDTYLARYDVVVATSEKADSLLRHRAGWMNDIRTLVVDEVHLLHDAGRGPTLEVLLARFRALVPSAQILALSATIRNADELAKWLGADLVVSEWRPTKLKKGVAFGRVIDFGADGERRIGPETGDDVADLVLDILDEGGQALVFLSTRRSAEATAKALAPKIAKRLTPDERAALAVVARAVSDDEEAAEFPEAVPPAPEGQLEEPPASKTLGGKLAQCVARGTAFHNAGLSSRQRRLVEANFRKGLLKVLSATPTLAAGVNTPARRVIIRDLYRYDVNLGNQPIPVLEAQQMMGRAGRPRYDPYGEAVLLAKRFEDVETLAASYLQARPEPITSKLGTEPALRVHVLAGIAAGFTGDVPSVRKFLDSTFYAFQGDAWLIHAQLDMVLRFLVDEGFVERQGDRLAPTPFGKRTSDLYIDPLSALILRQAIERARDRGAEPSDFAVLHAVTATPDLGSLFLRTKDDWVIGKMAEVEEDLLFEVHEARSQEEFLSQVKTAALLEDWIEEVPLDRIEERFGVGPGDVRQKVDLAEWLTHAMRELARLVHFDTATALNHLPLRLRAGARKELLPLIELEGVGRVRARTLHRHGFTSLGKIRAARMEELSHLPGFGVAIATNLKKQVGSKTPDEVSLGAFGA